MSSWQRILFLTWRDTKLITRDQRMLIVLLFTSVLLYPLLFIGMGYFQKAQSESLEQQQTTVWVRGEGWEAIEKVIAPPFNVIKNSSEQSFQSREIQGILDLKSDNNQTVFVLQHRSDSSLDLKLLNDIQNWYSEVQSKLRNLELQKHNLTEQQLTPYLLETQDVTPVEQQKNPIIDMMPYFVLLSVLVCGQVIGIDITAGEKERRTLTTLLASPHQAIEIGISKTITTTIFSAISSMLTIVSIYFSFQIVSDMYEMTLPLVITPHIIAQLFTLLTASSILLSGLVVGISIVSKSLKEANAWVTPLLIFVIFLGAIFSSVDASKFSDYLFVPIVNCIVALKCAFTHSLDPWMWIQSIAVIFIYGFITIFAVAQLFKQEKFLFR